MRRPNAVQKLLHRFVMLRPVTAFFAPLLHHLDGWVLQLSHGKHALSEIVGWNIVQLHTTGARTGKPRVLSLVGMLDGEKIALIASNFGRERNPAWYYNLKKNPDCEAWMGGGLQKYTARETEGAEREKYWRLALSWYVGYEKYAERAAPRRIPVMVLEPIKELPE